VNKSQLISTVASDTETKLDLVDTIVDSLFSTIRATAAKGENISISGFGVFRMLEHAARTGDNPRTHEPIHIPAFKTLTFRVSKTAKKELNRGVNDLI
jgi:nucleoid DNA-binding protein